jgi:stage V sporulation protein R
VLKHVARLWGFGVYLESVDGSGTSQQTLSVPAPAPQN